jgi:hypothetical protein
VKRDVRKAFEQIDGVTKDIGAEVRVAIRE